MAAGAEGLAVLCPGPALLMSRVKTRTIDGIKAMQATISSNARVSNCKS